LLSKIKALKFSQHHQERMELPPPPGRLIRNFKDPMSFQTRSENGSLEFFDNLEDAIKEYDNDPSIWKISYSTISEGNSTTRGASCTYVSYNISTSYRWRPKRKNEIWENESRLIELSEEYKNAGNDELFWINQPLDKDYLDFLNECWKAQFEKRSIYKNDDEIETAASRVAIKNVVSDNNFRDLDFMKQFI
jgi:hypothetical protein